MPGGRLQDRRWRKGGPGQGHGGGRARSPPHTAPCSPSRGSAPCQRAWSPRGRRTENGVGRGRPAAGHSDARSDRAGLEHGSGHASCSLPEGRAKSCGGSHAAVQPAGRPLLAPEWGWQLVLGGPSGQGWPPCCCSLSGWGAVAGSRRASSVSSKRLGVLWPHVSELGFLLRVTDPALSTRSPPMTPRASSLETCVTCCLVAANESWGPWPHCLGARLLARALRGTSWPRSRRPPSSADHPGQSSWWAEARPASPGGAEGTACWLSGPALCAQEKQDQARPQEDGPACSTRAGCAGIPR